MSLRYSEFSTPIGPLRVIHDGEGLVDLSFLESPDSTAIPPDAIRDDAFFHDLSQAIFRYAHGEAPLPKWKLGAIRATDFQKRVWRELQAIPHGQVRTYGEIAKKLGQPKAMRAVGGACGRNPVPLFVPCHRVLAASGMIGGFSAGLSIKRHLLRIEGIAYRE